MPVPIARIDDQFAHRKPTADPSPDRSDSEHVSVHLHRRQAVGTWSRTHICLRLRHADLFKSRRLCRAPKLRPAHTHTHTQTAPRVLRPLIITMIAYCAKLGTPSIKHFVPGRPKREAQPKMEAGLCAPCLAWLDRAPHGRTRCLIGNDRLSCTCVRVCNGRDPMIEGREAYGLQLASLHP